MPATRLEFYPLTFVEDRDGVTIGRSDIESYAVLPADGAALLRRLVDGMALDEAAAWYHTTFGESVDMDDFVATLHELEFVRLNGVQVAAAPVVRYRALGQAVFSPVGWLCFAALAGVAIVAAIRHPELRPHAHNLFFVPSLVIVQVVMILTQPPLVLVHEWFHVVAGRRLGLPTELGISRRLFFVVFETRLNGLLGVDRKKRYLPFLAGMVADVAMFSALTIFAWLADGWPGRLALAVAFMTLFRLVWQFYVFLRTDVYYVIVTMLGCTDLHAATTDYFRRRFGFLPGVGTPAAEPNWSPRDRRLAPWFAVVTVLGLGVLLATTAFAIIPIIVEFGTRLASALAHGHSGEIRFWDSAVSLLLLILELIVLPLIVGRRQRRTS